MREMKRLPQYPPETVKPTPVPKSMHSLSSKSKLTAGSETGSHIWGRFLKDHKPTDR